MPEKVSTRGAFTRPRDARAYQRTRLEMHAVRFGVSVALRTDASHAQTRKGDPLGVRSMRFELHFVETADSSQRRRTRRQDQEGSFLLERRRGEKLREDDNENS